MGETAEQEKCRRDVLWGGITLCGYFEGRPRQQMHESCRKLLAGLVAKRAADALSDYHTSANGKVDASMCSSGIGWAEQMVRYASAHRVSLMIRRKLANPSAKPYAKRPRTDLHAVWFPVDGVPVAGGSQWWASLKKAGLTQETSREILDGVSAELQEWFICCPEDSRDTR